MKSPDDIIQMLRDYSDDCNDSEACCQCTIAWMCEKLGGGAPKIIADTIERLQFPHWIQVSERLPEPEQRVLVCAETRCTDGKTYRHITTGMYENGKMWRENSSWNFNNFDNLGCYDKEQGDYKIPEGWWEYTIYNDEEGNYPIDDFVTHWMLLPEPPKENGI